MTGEFMDLKRYEMNGKENIYALINLYIPYLAFDLYDDINMSAMLEAIKEAISFHTLFGTRLIFENGLFYFEENPKPPIVFDSDNAPEIYGTDANNNYPWLFVVQKKRLIFHTIHAVADGAGAFGFCKTVLHLYFKNTGVKFEDKITDFPKGNPEETIENAYDKYANTECNSLGTPKFSSSVKLDTSFLQENTNSPWRLVISDREIHKFARKSETSVFSVISCILSRAMAKAYKIESGNIGVRVPVNLRGFFPSVTDRNFVQGFTLCYISDKMNSVSDSKVETAFRSQLDIWTEKDNLIKIINEDKETMARFRSGPEEMEYYLNSEYSPEFKADILYTHITRPDFSEELLSRISDIHFESNKIRENMVSVYGVTMKSDIKLTIQQCSKNDRYIKALKEVLDLRGISYELYPFELAPARNCLNTTALIERNYNYFQKT